MFPRNNKKGEGPFPRIRGITSSAKFTFVSSLNIYYMGAMTPREKKRKPSSAADCPVNPIRADFVRREHPINFLQGYGSVIVKDANFLRFRNRHEEEEGSSKRKDNGHCASENARLVDRGHVRFKMIAVTPPTRTSELVDITVTRDSILVMVMVCLSAQPQLEYPLIRLVSFRKAIQEIDKFRIDQVAITTIKLRRTRELESAARWNCSIACLCLRWAYIAFSLCAFILTIQPSRVSGWEIAESMDDSSSSSAFSLPVFDWNITTTLNDVKANEDAGVDDFQKSLGLASPPENQHFVQSPTLYPVVGTSDSEVQPVLQEQREVPATQWAYQQQQQPQQQRFSPVDVSSGGQIHFRFEPVLVQQEVPSKVSTPVALPVENKSAVVSSVEEVGATEKASQVDDQSSGANWDPIQLLLQVCPELANDEPVDYIAPLDDDYSVLELSKYLPPVPVTAPSVVEPVGGNNSASGTWQVTGWGSGGAGPSNVDILKPKLMTKIKPMQTLITGRYPRHPSRPPPPYSQHMMQRNMAAKSQASNNTNNNNSKIRTTSVNDLIARVVMEMLGYMGKDNNKLNNGDPSSLAKSGTNSSEGKGGEQGGGGASTSTGGYGAGQGSFSGNGTTPQGSAAPQQYILGCAGSNRGYGGGEEERDRDGSTITLKKLLETPYSPRGKSTRNRELEEYQQMLAEEDLRKKIEELRAKDKRGNGNNGNFNNSSGGWGSN